MPAMVGYLNHWATAAPENMCKADVRKGLEDGLAMRLPLSEPSEIYKDKLETDNWSNIGSEFNFEIDLPGKRDRSTIYRLNLIKLYRRKPELANLVMEKSSEGIDSEILHSVKLFMDFGFQGEKSLENRGRPRDFCDLPIRRDEGRVVNTPLVFKKGSFSGDEGKKSREEPALYGEKGRVRRLKWKDDERRWR
ncbi:uncharacterized protein TNCV_422091 [Trichonephila clavipes]|nr:uncharacterized protein TNCV_422091 [Trichonephila clavipes]